MKQSLKAERCVTPTANANVLVSMSKHLSAFLGSPIGVYILDAAEFIFGAIDGLITVHKTKSLSRHLHNVRNENIFANVIGCS